VLEIKLKVALGSIIIRFVIADTYRICMCVYCPPAHKCSFGMAQ